MSTAPTAFQQFITQCLSGLRDSICIPYLDDILCYEKTFDEHLENLRTVFRRQFGVKLKAKKYILLKPEIKYLGKNNSEKGNKDNPINTEAIKKLREPPKTVGDENFWDFWVITGNLLKVFKKSKTNI